MKPVQLLTGRPGSGKTSLIKQALAETKLKAGGFYTEEIRQQGIREGFRLVTLNGQETILSHTGIRSPHRVGKYGVDIDSFDRTGVAELHRAIEQCELVVIDEIGKMELFSTSFREAVNRIINSGQRVLGSIMLAPHPWADAIKCMPQVNLLTVSRANCQTTLEYLLMWLKDTGIPGKSQS